MLLLSFSHTHTSSCHPAATDAFLGAHLFLSDTHTHKHYQRQTYSTHTSLISAGCKADLGGD